MGLIISLIIGGIVGWLASMAMKTDAQMGVIANVVIGVVGSRLLSAIPAIGRYVAVKPTLGLIAATAMAAIILGVLGSFYPALVATRQSPAAALERA